MYSPADSRSKLHCLALGTVWLCAILAPNARAAPPGGGPSPALALSSEALPTPLPVGHGLIEVDTDPAGALVFLGLTPLGLSPLAVALPVGRHELSTFLPGRLRGERTLPVREGERRRWSMRLGHAYPPLADDWPHDAPAWVRADCRALGGCGLGEARHLSPMLTESLAVVRALVEATTADASRLQSLDRAYRSARGEDPWAAVRQRADAHVTLGRLDRWAGADWMIVRRTPGWTPRHRATGAADPRAPAAQADDLAAVAALARALSWHVAGITPLRVRSAQLTYDESLHDGAWYEGTAEVVIEGALGGPHHRVSLSARLRDHQTVTVTRQHAPRIEEVVEDLLRVRWEGPAGAGEALIEGGVTAWINGAEPAAARAVLEAAAAEAGLLVRWSVVAPRDGWLDAMANERQVVGVGVMIEAPEPAHE